MSRSKIELVADTAPPMEFTYPKRGDADGEAKSPEKKSPVTWRAPKAAYTFVRSVASRGYRIGDVITDAVLMWRDIVTELDPLWVYVMLEAKRRGVAPGVAIALLARDAIVAKHPDATSDQRPDDRRK